MGDGKDGAQGGKPPTSALGFADIANTLTNGRNNMPPFGNVMPKADMQDVASPLLCSPEELGV